MAVIQIVSWQLTQSSVVMSLDKSQKLGKYVRITISQFV